MCGTTEVHDIFLLIYTQPKMWINTLVLCLLVQLIYCDKSGGGLANGELKVNIIIVI